MFNGAKIEKLTLIATEINLNIKDKRAVADLNKSIENSHIYENKSDFVIQIANTIIENRKNEEQKQFYRKKNET